MTPKNFGPGIAPAVSVVDGLVYLAFGFVGGCRLVVLTPAGVEVRRFDLPGGFDQSYPRFDGPWLAYRLSEVQGFHPAVVNVLTGQVWTFAEPAGGTFCLAVSEPFAVVAFEFQRKGEPWHIWFGYMVDGSTSETPLPGAPDGLDTIIDGAHVSLRKDTRLSVPGMLYPVRARDLTVGEGQDGGTMVLLDHEPMREAFAGQNVPDPRCATDGLTYAITAWGPAGVQLVIGTRADLQALPLATSVPVVGRKLWCGWFEFGAAPGLPSNCGLAVDADVLVRDRAGNVVAQYVASEGLGPELDLLALEAAIAAAKSKRPGVPTLCYWTRKAQASRVPVGAELVGVEAYRQAGETLDAFEARIRASVARVRAAWLIAQCYTSNPGNDPDLAALVPVYARIARDCANVAGVLAFSAGSRATGWSDHPEVHAAWAALFAGITGTPSLDPRSPIPDPPREEFMDPWKVTVKSFGPSIVRGQDFKTRVALGNGVEVEFEKDAHDELHIAVFKDGVQQDRSASARHVEVKG